MVVEKEIVCQLSQGLQARVAIEFITKANTFSSIAILKKDNRNVDCKSIMGIMGLALRKGDVVTLIAHGKDEDIVIKTLGDFLLNI